MPSWCRVVRADNPGPMTLEGTNTYLVETAEGTVVVDPGPLLADHLDAITATDSAPVMAVVTHHHPDHTEASQQWHQRTGAPVRAFDPTQCIAADPVVDGDELNFGNIGLQIMHTPGH